MQNELNHFMAFFGSVIAFCIVMLYSVPSADQLWLENSIRILLQETTSKAKSKRKQKTSIKLYYSHMWAQPTF